jgi:hypothetical protein
MRALVSALVALALGVAVGIVWSKQEFSHEVKPVDLVAIANASGEAGTRGVTAPKIGPKVMVVNGERHDFGSMDRNAHGKWAYEIRNVGDAPLELKTGQPSCGICIKVFNVAKPILAPGEQTVVNIEWDVKTSNAEFEQSGPLETNDPNRKSVHLSLHGHVIDNVRLERQDMHFHDLSPSESASGSVNIYAFREGELNVEHFEHTQPRVAEKLTVSFAPLTDSELAREPKAKTGLKVNVELKPGLPQGDFEDTLNITTNQSPDPLTLKVIGNIASDIMLMGPNVFRDRSLVNLGAIPQKQGKKHTMYLLVKGPHRDDVQVSIESIEPTIDFSAKLGEPIRDTAKTVRYPILLEGPPGAAPVTRGEGSFAHVHLKTTHPEVKDIDLRVRYVVRE